MVGSLQGPLESNPSIGCRVSGYEGGYMVAGWACGNDVRV